MSEFNDVLTSAKFVDVVTSYDAEGWEVFTTFAVGDVVIAGSLAYRIAGFNSDNQALAFPHGLGHATGALAPRSYWLDLKCCEQLRGADAPMRHRDGFVVFG
jgi:hypothetical protein